MTEKLTVDFLGNEWDLRVVIMGQLGFSTKAIQEQTDLTKCQVQYRLGKSETKRKDYRDGVSNASKYVLRKSKDYLTAQARVKFGQQRRKAI